MILKSTGAVQLTNTDFDLMISSLKDLGSTFPIAFNEFKADILIGVNHVKLEQLLTILLPRLFEKYELPYIYNWLKPLDHLQLNCVEAIKAMYVIREEPDQQHFMGELYYKLNLLPQALDCFLWDVELHPNNLRPIRWLTKLYHEMGMLEEARSYQCLYKQIQKSS